MAGAPQLNFRLAAAKDAPLGQQYIVFTKTEGTAKAYAEVPSLRVIINRDRATFTLPSGSAILVPAGGMSVPVRFSVSSLPHTDVRLKPVFTNTTVGITSTPEGVAFVNQTDSLIIFNAPGSAKKRRDYHCLLHC
jgi:hypothetical protein